MPFAERSDVEWQAWLDLASWLVEIQTRCIRFGVLERALCATEKFIQEFLVLQTRVNKMASWIDTIIRLVPQAEAN